MSSDIDAGLLDPAAIKRTLVDWFETWADDEHTPVQAAVIATQGVNGHAVTRTQRDQACEEGLKRVFYGLGDLNEKGDVYLAGVAHVQDAPAVTRALFVETTEALENTAKHSQYPEPNFQIITGDPNKPLRRQYVWLLEESIQDIASWEQCQENIRRFFGGAKSATNARTARIAIPGTIHHGTKKTIQRHEMSDRLYEVAHLYAAFDDASDHPNQPPDGFERSGAPNGAKNFSLQGDWMNAARDTAPTSYTFLQAASFLDGFEPPNFIVQDILAERSVYSLTAHPGVGKTLVALMLAEAVASGKPFGDKKTAQRRVVYFAGENQTDIQQRLLLSFEEREVDPRGLDLFIVPGVFQIHSAGEKLREDLTQIGGASVIIVDTTAAFFPGDSENDNVQMNAYAKLLRSLTLLPGGPAVLTLSHPSKGATDNELIPRGGNGFYGEIDGNMFLTGDQENVTLHRGAKMRGPGFEPMTFAIDRITSKTRADKEGWPLRTAQARYVNEEEAGSRAERSHTEENLLMVNVRENDRMSNVKRAEALGWLSEQGKPLRSKVDRMLKKLVAEKMLRQVRDKYVLTNVGEEEVQWL